MKQHYYKLNVEWTGNKGTGTSHYKAYERSHTISIEGKPTLECSSDAPFLGDITKYNPEDFMLCSLATCHMLWYLHLCADEGIIVTQYTDTPTATLTQDETGAGKFTEVVLHPKVIVANASMIEKAIALHSKANSFCFMANSVNFKIKHEQECIAK